MPGTSGGAINAMLFAGTGPQVAREVWTSGGRRSHIAQSKGYAGLINDPLQAKLRRTAHHIKA